MAILVRANLHGLASIDGCAPGLLRNICVKTLGITDELLFLPAQQNILAISRVNFIDHDAGTNPDYFVMAGRSTL